MPGRVHEVGARLRGEGTAAATARANRTTRGAALLPIGGMKRLLILKRETLTAALAEADAWAQAEAARLDAGNLPADKLAGTTAEALARLRATLAAYGDAVNAATDFALALDGANATRKAAHARRRAAGQKGGTESAAARRANTKKAEILRRWLRMGTHAEERDAAGIIAKAVGATPQYVRRVVAEKKRT
jgi:hypothetical protein